MFMYTKAYKKSEEVQCRVANELQYNIVFQYIQQLGLIIFTAVHQKLSVSIPYDWTESQDAEEIAKFVAYSMNSSVKHSVA